MSDIAQLGFSVSTQGLKKGEVALDKFAATGEKTEKRTTKSSKEMSSSYRSLAAAVGTVTVAIVSMNKIISVTRQFDILNAQLITATGSTENAAKAFEAIQKFAARTPFDLAQVTDSFNKLVNLGLTPSERALESYGNTASSMGKSLNQLIEAVADAATGEFERLKEFGIKTKSEGDKVTLTFRGVKTTIKKEAADIEKFLIDLGENEFAGAMQQRVDTLDGAISNLGDSWDTLFLTISQAGIGGLIEDSVRDGISSLDDMNDFLKSGQINESIDLLTLKFAGFASDIDKMFDRISGTFLTDSQFWVNVVDNFVALSKESLFSFPENMRAMIQLAGVEIGALVIMADTHFTAFGKVIGIKLAEIGQKAAVFGRQLAVDLSPFSTGAFDFEGELSRISELSTGMTNEILNNANAMAEAAIQLRRDSISAILDEREVALQSSADQVNSIVRLGEEFDKIKAKRNESTEDQLAQFKIIADENESQSSFTDKQVSDMEKLTNEVENFGGAWSRTGSVIIDAFGGISDSISDYMSQLKALDAQQSDIDKKRQKGGADSVALDNLEKQVNQNKVMAELKGLGALSKASGSLFKEKTVASKAFAALSKIIAIAEIALSFQKMAASTVETGVVVANETTKQGANALTAITAAFGAPWPIGFVAGAAMIGVMASLLGGSSGGGSGVSTAEQTQETQGTGTVLGSDEKTQSIINSQELFVDIAIDQLAELKGIRDSLTNVDIGVDKLAVSITGGFGEFRGGADVISSVSKELLFDPETLLNVIRSGMLDVSAEFLVKRSIEGGSSRNQIRFTKETQGLENNLRSEFGSVIIGIADSISESVDLLGLKTSKSITSFLVDIGNVNFEDLTGEEIQEELKAIFGQQADLMSQFLVPELVNFQRVGEGLFETLARITSEQVIFNDALDFMGGRLTELSSIMQIEVAQSIIGLVGGMERFSDLTTEFFEEFFTEEEQFERLSASLNESVNELGVSMFTNRDAFRSAIEGIDKTTESGQRLFAGLIELTPAMDDFFDSIEDNLSRVIGSASSALSILKSSVSAQQRVLKSELSKDLKDIKAEFDLARIAVKDRTEQQLDTMKRQLDIVNGQVSSLTTLSDLLSGSIDQVVGFGRDQARSLVQGAIDAARGGATLAGLDLRGAISSLSNIDESGFGTSLALQAERARTAAELRELESLTVNQLSIAEITAELIREQTETIKTGGDRQIEALEAERMKSEESANLRFDKEIEQLQGLIDTASKQLEALTGVRSDNITLAEAQTGFADAVTRLIAEQNAFAIGQAEKEEARQRESAAFFNNVLELSSGLSEPIEDRLPAVVSAVSTLRGLMEGMANTNFATGEVMTSIAVSSAKTAKLLDRWDGDGQPEIRDVS